MKPGDWPHHPIFVQAGDNMNALGIKRGSPVPLGVPFEVESGECSYFILSLPIFGRDYSCSTRDMHCI